MYEPLLEKNQGQLHERYEQKGKQNMNDNQLVKPIRQSYILNGQHKSNNKRKYIHYCTTENPKVKIVNGQRKVYQNQAFQKFNFKKTTGRKYSYSCSGYGGKCSGCKGLLDKGKKFRKINILMNQGNSKYLIKITNNKQLY